MSKPDLTRIDHFLSYDAETGAIRWRRSPSPRVRRGAIAGTLTLSGQSLIRLCYRAYRAEDVAWFLGHGEWPERPVYHVNGDWLDNRLDNLDMRGSLPFHACEEAAVEEA
jgi:hypothetical protein